MNDNAPESERWLPVEGDVGKADALDTIDPALDRARREAEAVIAKAFSREADTLPPPHRMPSQSTEPGD